MALPLSIFARPFIVEPRARATLVHPVVLLEGQAPSNALGLPDDTIIPTNPGRSPSRPTLTEPLVYEVKKAGKATNAFLMGITFGRTDNNDLVIADESVSRFHGYFDREPASGLWRISDMGSLNGTEVGGVKLSKGKPHLCGTREALVVGKVPLLFLMPDAFFAYVDQRL